MIKAKFVERKNRFTVLVELDGEVVEAHMANSGRLKELLKPGHEVYLVKKDAPGRVTAYNLALVNYGGHLVSVDAGLPNKVVREAVDRGELAEFQGCRVVKREVKYGNSRLDLLLEDKDHNRCYVEVKSVTLVDGGIARFPDAPTERGTRHLNELIRAVKEGNRAAVVFLIQREDAELFSPNTATDPIFSETLKKAVHQGVKIHAYICRVTRHKIRIVKPLPVLL